MRKNKYYLKEGKVHSNSLVLDIVKHCNLSCRGCGHLSPIFKKSITPSADLKRDLDVLGQSYHTKEVLVLGGEPLLHGELVDILSVIKDSSIGDSTKVLTNGLLLSKMDPRAWELMDEMRISVYPDSHLSQSMLEEAAVAASLHGTELSLQFYDRFRESIAETDINNPKLVRRIFNSCLIAHEWHCNTVENGYFFKCPQAYLIPKSRAQKDDNLILSDGIEISGSLEFPIQLLNYLTAESPLKSCNNCLGTVGNFMPHEQVLRSQWRNYQSGNADQMVDYEHLHALENGLVEDVPVRFIELVKDGHMKSISSLDLEFS